MVPFSLLATACHLDAPTLRGCRTYTQLCRPASVVRQCGEEGVPQGIVSRTELERLLKMGCAREWGHECDVCFGDKPGDGDLPEVPTSTITLVPTETATETATETSSEEIGIPPTTPPFLARATRFPRPPPPPPPSPTSPTYRAHSPSIPLPYPTHRPPACEPLLLYSSHCASHPTLPSCSSHVQFCERAAPVNFTLCPPTPEPEPEPEPGPERPQWRPFLHFFGGPPEYVVFDWAVVRGWGGLGAAMAIAFAIGVSVEALSWIGRRWERGWEVEDLRLQAERSLGVNGTGEGDAEEDGAAEGDGLLSPRVGIRARVRGTIERVTREGRRRTARAVQRLLGGVSIVALVLVVATFNGWLCLSVVGGLTVGAFVFGGLPNV
ncbi:hypothetical protein HK101_000546 [Irineochytrium annulatum]|nr:hypothetical protein HK101_000546 [Irineochytrium annulatum]